MDKTEKTKIKHAGAMPAPTWHFLNMNDVVVEIPAGLAIRPDVAVSAPWTVRGASDEFDNAFADAQAAWESAHPEPTAEERAEAAAFRAAEADATYGGTARSSYQIAADQLEESRSLSTAFEHGMGAEVAAHLRNAAGNRVVIGVGEGRRADVRIKVVGRTGTISVAAIDLIADTGSRIALSILVDGDADGADAGGADGAEVVGGVTGTTVRVFSDAGACVSIERTQTLGEGFIDIDDMALFASDDARIDVRQTVLGASEAYTGLAGDLRGEAARIDVDTSYLGMGSQSRDFNYALRHHGPCTQSNLDAHGVLAGESRKTLRGTIDLVRGCKGAQGSENENVLLLDEGVRNKTVPVILCNEDDVAGNHGATIGHIRDEQLFYLASRGLSQRAAEAMFASALVERAVLDAPDDATRAAVVRLGERLSPGFAALFD